MARAGVSQVELARRLGRSQQYISRRVVGSVSFGVDELETVASALGTTIDQLLSERAVKAGA
ncbi:helix-turn-helix transcriptional regulator [Gordonia sp. (in: high G+C Gram-positive bacteria)]|nr:helix-turn-helix transcriptional regulator [Gordonia sp. (in: high G+C Gram-positive bacteria)]HMS75643.1 helix-turn-helix transcriptional regulator [Gordonia sp. (in: high G+C Gram-positive bacteria)]HQV18795.1 helix-turn-helix transcriptional regulator [Gordonia sp. (in: high G+C Gram-positive bacteria)]